ncbi:MAG: hypothetical protein RL033_5733, partial [Pseudomonadota bacterium]
MARGLCPRDLAGGFVRLAARVAVASGAGSPVSTRRQCSLLHLTAGAGMLRLASRPVVATRCATT